MMVSEHLQWHMCSVLYIGFRKKKLDVKIKMLHIVLVFKKESNENTAH